MSTSKSLNFIQTKNFLPIWTMVGIFILILGSLCLFNIWRKAEQLQAQEDNVQQEIHALSNNNTNLKKVAVDPIKSIPTSQKLAVSNSIRELQITWDALFSALEKANHKDVTLLSLQPDSKKQQVILSGEAKDYPTILIYVDGLAKQPMLSNVYLQRHAVNEADKDKPVRFTILAHWQTTNQVFNP